MVHGPFDIPLERGGGAELDVQAFWRSAAPAKLRDRSGCYVFALQRVKGLSYRTTWVEPREGSWMKYSTPPTS
jgi:hypothetical protein